MARCEISLEIFKKEPLVPASDSVGMRGAVTHLFHPGWMETRCESNQKKSHPLYPEPIEWDDRIRVAIH